MLNLSSNCLTDACLVNVIELAKSNKVLKKINLGQNSISARKAADIVKVLNSDYGVTLTV